MKHVALVAPHFIPSNLTSVHRARLLAESLSDFGWEPTVVCVHEKYYEEALEPDLLRLLSSKLRVVKAGAFPVRPFKIVGDIGIRGFGGLLKAILALHREKPIDFLYITIPSNFAALLGPLIRKQTGIPYGIDYIDPWVHRWPGVERFAGKAWGSYRLGRLLEPLAVRRASLITGINRVYYQAMLDRNPLVAKQAVLTAMPYGWSSRDFEEARKIPASVPNSKDGKFDIVYAGALLPKSHTILERLFEAVKNDGELRDRVRLSFIGTGHSLTNPRSFTVMPIAKRYGLENVVYEHPHRMPYLSVLNRLSSADAVLVLGSTEKHYSPSKIFQALASGRPVLTIVHEEMDLLPFLKTTCIVRTMSGHSLPSVETIAGGLRELMEQRHQPPGLTERLSAYSARNSSRILAAALNEALEGKV